MEPVSVALAPLAKAILSQVGKELGGFAVKGAKVRVLGDPERKALERALGRAFAMVEGVHGRRLADFDVNAGFLEHEGASELAKLIVPGNRRPGATALAELCVDSLGRSQSDDQRWDRIGELRPVFVTLLDAVAAEVRQEAALRAVLGHVDDAEVARVTGQIARHAGAASATGEDRTHYLWWLIDQHRYLRIAGVVRKTTVQLPLGEVFVGLQSQRDRYPGDRARAWLDREQARLSVLLESGQLDQTEFEAALDQLQIRYGRKFPAEDEHGAGRVLPVLEAARETTHLLVLGDPGTGKTTLLRYLALTHAEALLTSKQVDGRAPLFPIYMRIGDYARQAHPGAGISEFLPDYLRRLECQTPGLADLVRRQLEAGRCLVLLDGLDEIVSAEQRRDVVAAVVNFVTANGRQGNQFVVTSRISGYLAAPLPDPFRAVRLQDMDNATIGRFLAVYCRELERAETPGKSKHAILDAGRREATAIEEALTVNAGVRRLAANPLLLTALVLVHRASGRLPHRRVEAYIEVCNALGRTWRSAQGVAEADLPDERLLTRWLTELGSWLHEHRSEGAATKRELLQVLGPLWAAHHGYTWDPGELQAADPLDTDAGRGVIEFIDKADTHTGLLVELAPGRYGFAHLTFEEYYAGRALAFRGSATERVTAIRSHLHDPRYDEPILLALGLIGTDYTEQIDDVVTEAIYPAHGRPSPHEDLLGRDFLFMLQVLADDTPLQTATIDAIVNQAIEEWLSPQHSRCRYTAYRDALSQRLAALGATRAGERLRIALDNHATVISPATLLPWCQLAEIAGRLGPLPAATVTTLVKLATGATPMGVHERAVSALASSEALTPPVITALAQIAIGAADPLVRLDAVAALASSEALTTPPVITALVELATGAADPGVRARAVSALASGEVLTPPVITALAQLATGAADPGLRVQAGSALASRGALTPPVITALVELATSAANPGLRARAVSALASGEVLTPPVITALAQIATNDA
ncbi:MAG: NACHT domain-containing protein, partial [Actinoallomurus sp.]